MLGGVSAAACATANHARATAPIILFIQPPVLTPAMLRWKRGHHDADPVREEWVSVQHRGVHLPHRRPEPPSPRLLVGWRAELVATSTFNVVASQEQSVSRTSGARSCVGSRS